MGFSDKQPCRKLGEESDFISLVHISGADAETVLIFLMLINRLESKKKPSNNWWEEENNSKRLEEPNLLTLSKGSCKTRLQSINSW